MYLKFGNLNLKGMFSNDLIFGMRTKDQIFIQPTGAQNIDLLNLSNYGSISSLNCEATDDTFTINNSGHITTHSPTIEFGMYCVNRRTNVNYSQTNLYKITIAPFKPSLNYGYDITINSNWTNGAYYVLTITVYDRYKNETTVLGGYPISTTRGNRTIGYYDFHYNPSTRSYTLIVKYPNKNDTQQGYNSETKVFDTVNMGKHIPMKVTVESLVGDNITNDIDLYLFQSMLTSYIEE